MVDFIHPCPGAALTSKFGYRTIYGKREFHQGCDFAKSGNVPILASADGVVKKYISDNTSYGKVIFIKHEINGKQMDTTYAHLKSYSVKDGQKVKQGQIIGYMGNTDGGTGRSTGQHLHFEIHNGPWKSGQPNAVDPMLYINKEPKPEAPKTKKLYLPSTADAWSVYPTNKEPVKSNAIGSLNPKKFGGLTYDILGNPKPNVYTIKTSNFGTVNIYAASSTGAVIK